MEDCKHKWTQAPLGYLYDPAGSFNLAVHQECKCGAHRLHRIEGDAIDAEEESRIPAICYEEAATQAMVERGDTHA